MTCIFETEINAAHIKLAGSYANAENNVKWMFDLERIEALSGEPEKLDLNTDKLDNRN